MADSQSYQNPDSQLADAAVRWIHQRALMTKNLRYVAGCARNWRYEMQAAKDSRQKGSDPYDE